LAIARHPKAAIALDLLVPAHAALLVEDLVLVAVLDPRGTPFDLLPLTTAGADPLLAVTGDAAVGVTRRTGVAADVLHVAGLTLAGVDALATRDAKTAETTGGVVDGPTAPAAGPLEPATDVVADVNA
jgi:hypothetical protein